MENHGTGGGRRRFTALVALALLVGIASRAHGALFDCEHWVQVLPDVHPEPRYGHAMVWDSDRHVAILFGGFGPLEIIGTKVYGDLWEFDPATVQWSKIEVAGLTPEPRAYHGMAYDSARKRVVLFGGLSDPSGDDATDFLGDVWEYDPGARMWTLMEPVGGPVGRAGAPLAYDPVRHRTVLFSGFNYPDHYLTSTWEWDGAAWTQAFPVHLPHERAYHAMTWSGSLGKIVLLGGFVESGTFDLVFDDTWTWDGTDWTQLGTTIADSCYAESMASDPTRGHVLVFGDCGDGIADNTFLLEPPYDAWKLVRDAEVAPRTSAAMVVGDDSQAILFGGIDSANVLGDTWILKGFPPEIATQPLDRESAPCLANQFHVVARTDVQGVGPFTYRWRKYHPNGFFQIDDGFRFSGATTDTLVIDPFRPEDVGNYAARVSNACGTTESVAARLAIADGHWTASGQLPSPRHFHELAYDTARQRMVSFGGLQSFYDGSLLPLGDTIERNGIAWQEVVPSGPSPSPRYGYALAYDAGRGVTVLHGGRTFDASFNFTDFGDTWEWDGTSWSLRTSSGPSPRFSHEMAYDPSRQRVVLFGGQHNSAFYNDLWEWDGTTWTSRGTMGDATFGLPAGRDEHGLAFDTSRGVLVLHGGQYLLNPPTVVGGETWELAGSQWTRRAAAQENTPLYLPDHRAMAYDADRHTTLLAARPDGDILQNPLQSVSFFEWASGAWTQKPGVPPWRSFAAMEYDPVRKATVLAGGSNACLPHLSPACSLSDTWEWEYFQYDPTCGATVCGDGIVDAPAEDCEPGDSFEGPCCSQTCTRRPQGTACSFKVCPEGVCDADGTCVCSQGTCGNGIVEAGEECDDGATHDGCCSPACLYVQSGSVCGDPCLSSTCQATPGSGTACTTGAPLPGCSPSGSVIGYLPGDGTLMTPDLSLILQVLDGDPRTYGIASGLTTSQFGVGTADTRVLVARLTPEGATLNAIVTFRWPDADDDGVVDGTSVAESTLRVYKNGQPITPRCDDPATASCLALPCCDRQVNRFSVHVSSFSEFVVVSEPDGGTTTTTSPIVTTTTAPPATTTTTIPPCDTPRCAIDDARQSAPCAGHVPASVGKKLDRALTQAELAPSQTPKKAAKLYKGAKRLLGKASRAVLKASRGKHPQLSPDCATSLRNAIAVAIGRVGV